jgi:hypothetical protein
MSELSLSPTSYLAFLSALTEKKDFSTSPTAEQMVAYCVELANLCIDFDRMEDSLFRYWGVIDTMGESDSAVGLALKKFLVVYTEDNTVLRVHAYRERVFQLTNAVLALGLPEDKPQMIDRVCKILQERGHITLLRHLESLSVNKSPAIRDALDRRNEFVHRLPTREWMTLRSGAQLQDWLDLHWDTETFQSKDPAYVQLEADNLQRKWGLVLDFIKSLKAELDTFEEGFCLLLWAVYFGFEEKLYAVMYEACSGDRAG